MNKGLKCCYGMDIFSGHVIFKTLLKRYDWLLRFLFAFYGIFSFNLLLSGKNVSFYLFSFFFFFFFQNLTNFDIDSYILTSDAGYILVISIFHFKQLKRQGNYKIQSV